ncbi:MAG: hypothetical protein QXQ37_04875 [Nitrososphaerota archaeon]
MSHIGGSWYWRMLSEQVELEEKKHTHVSEHKEEKVVVSTEDENRYLDSEQGVVVNMSIVSEAASQVQEQQQEVEVASTEAVEQKEPQVEVASVEHDDDVDADIDPDVSIEVKTEPVRRVKVRRKSREQE